eukprot:TRINITY_DN2466_c0_g1_i1.p1 TRINITY_DN2466_c0_g1~~TRINITY_DN2466_c0_g1_i1.p1  ORF type:complete len:122 (-),score=35.96 TRINITY_DN2466_c0_g1_i1:136-501(-)
MSREMSRARFVESRNGSDRGNAHSAAFEEATMRENDEHIRNLSNKAALLKSVSLDILGDVKEDNKRLDGMTSDFDGVSGMLKGTMDRLDSVVGMAKAHKMITLVGGVLFVLIILYYFATSG